MAAITASHIRAARGLLDWTRDQLVERSGVPKSTIVRVETEAVSPRSSTLATIRATLEAAGVEFVGDNDNGVGLRLKKAEVCHVENIPLSVSALPPVQCRAARALLNWSQDDLASASGIPKRTIVRYEISSVIPRSSTIAAIRTTFESAGVEFVGNKDNGAGARLKNTAHCKVEDTPVEVSLLTLNQCRAARALLNWTQDQLVAASQVTKKTIADFERGARTPYSHNLAAMRATFESAGVEFVGDNDSDVGVRLKRPPDRNVENAIIPLPLLLPVQSKMARIAVGWGVRDLAHEANVSADTIARLERGDFLKKVTVAAIRAALESAGVEFVNDRDGSCGVLIKRDKAKI